MALAEQANHWLSCICHPFSSHSNLFLFNSPLFSNYSVYLQQQCGKALSQCIDCSFVRDF